MAAAGTGSADIPRLPRRSDRGQHLLRLRRQRSDTTLVLGAGPPGHEGQALGRLQGLRAVRRDRIDVRGQPVRLSRQRVRLRRDRDAGESDISFAWVRRAPDDAEPLAGATVRNPVQVVELKQKTASSQKAGSGA